MSLSKTGVTRRRALAVLAGVPAAVSVGWAAAQPAVTVHYDPACGCCSGWVEHLRSSGFSVTTIETTRLNAVKARLGVPADLASCHTGEVAGYVVEGHVPAVAINRLLTELPSATGLAVAGMPVGSPGMEGGTPEPYEVVMFGKGERRTYMRCIGDNEA